MSDVYEPKKCSTRRSGAKKGPPKYQNTEAFRHNRNSALTRKILALPINGLCSRCTEILEWRKRFRKYKPLTTKKKWYASVRFSAQCTLDANSISSSVQCGQRNIKEAYHVICEACQMPKGLCAKCLVPCDAIKPEENGADIEHEFAEETDDKENENGVSDVTTAQRAM